MPKLIWLLPLASLFLPALPAAQTRDAAQLLTDAIKTRVPPAWEVRVRWRDGSLLASITPLPYQQAFELWYAPERLAETLRGLCPGSGEPVWHLLADNQDVILEPTVGGKSGLEARVSCRGVLKERA